MAASMATQATTLFFGFFFNIFFAWVADDP